MKWFFGWLLLVVVSVVVVGCGESADAKRSRESAERAKQGSEDLHNAVERMREAERRR